MSAGPFMKWAGGKRRQAAIIADALPRFVEGVYYEPFVGAGAVFFELARRRALRAGGVLLADANEELVNVWLQVQADASAVCREARQWPNTEDWYKAIRERPFEATAAGAARTLWLNRTCFNGLFRLNKSRGFNVPWGGTGRRGRRDGSLDEGNLHQVGHLLRKLDVVVIVQDFARTLAVPKAGDAVYCDPPYWPVSKSASFSTYTGDRFEPVHHQALVEGLCALDEGVTWRLSSSDAEGAVALYTQHGLTWDTLLERRPINGTGSKRGPVQELLVRR